MKTKINKQTIIIVKLIVVVTMLMCLVACNIVVNPSMLERYNVTYNGNGATEGTVPSKQTKIHGTPLTLATNNGNLKKTGYTFTGWNTQADGKGTTYAAGASYTTDASIKLYALWELPCITINGKKFEKTQEIIVIANGTNAIVHKTDESSYSKYHDGAFDMLKGVFVKDRSVTLSPFILGKYEVTQELYEAVMGINPSENQGDSFLPAENEKQELRPVEKISWYDAVAFCNELTRKTMSENDCVYNITITTQDETTNTITEAEVSADYTKKGYRLPTEAEWEFAARGGDPEAEAWSYAYAGVQTDKTPEEFIIDRYDEKLDAYCWYIDTNGTHEVGKKKANSLSLYDMSGNVYEWCYDWYVETINTDAVINSLGPMSGTERVFRGGCVGAYSNYCSVSLRGHIEPSSVFVRIGIRLCRSGQ